MATIYRKAYVNAQGQLEFVEPLALPTNVWVDVTIEVQPPVEERTTDDEKWDAAFARSKDLLRKMGREAARKHREGKTVELDLDEIDLQ